jgi:predicted transcriptional regulator
MNKKYLMKIIYSDGERIKDITLPKKQREIIEWVRTNKEVRASELSSKLKCSMQSASTRLHALSVKGWLDRRSVKSISGGIEYIYSFPKFLDDK